MALHDARDGQIWEYQQLLQGFQRHFRFLSSSFADDCVMFMGAYLFVYLLGSRIGMVAFSSISMHRMGGQNEDKL